tara:strand:- start:41 stop:751 length:711 start_codon:yes stop_codon:yes gene_type:complete
MNSVDEISKTLDGILNPIFSDKIGAAVVTLVIVLYAGLAAPKLPKSVAGLFKSKIFKIVILSLIAYTSTKNVSVAVISAIALVVSMQTLSKYERSDVVIKELEKENEEPQTEESAVETESPSEPEPASDSASEPASEPEQASDTESSAEKQKVTGVKTVPDEKYATYKVESSDSEEVLNTSEEDRIVAKKAEEEVNNESSASPVGTFKHSGDKFKKLEEKFDDVEGFEQDDMYASY